MFALEIELIDLANYVVFIANRNNNIDGGIIYTAGMDIKKQTSSSKRIFSVVNTTYEVL